MAPDTWPGRHWSWAFRGACRRQRRSPDLASAAFSCPGCGPAGVLREYSSERDVAAGDVLFADGDRSYDLIVLLAGTADIVEGYGPSGGKCRGQLRPVGVSRRDRYAHRAALFLSAVATSAGRVLAVPVEELRRVMAGVPLRDVQDAASHADPRTTMRYEVARVAQSRRG